jgi:D-inositol-3-phosphate glycosyltransferase
MVGLEFPTTPRCTLDKKPRVLWVGDAGVASGFARGTHYICATLVRCGWDVIVLGMNYTGDPHEHPFKIFPAFPGGDSFGIGRIGELVAAAKPQVILIQQDPWNIKVYVDEIRKRDTKVPIAASLAVDGLNVQGDPLNGLTFANFWTKFGYEQAKLGGYRNSASVIPLGIDRTIYYPVDKTEARSLLDVHNDSVDLQNTFIVGNVNRNQPRKRMDLTVRYFARWVKEYSIPDAYLYLHVCPTGDTGYDVRQLMSYYGLRKRLIVHEPHIGYGISEDSLRMTYGLFDLMFSTTQGEGFGLTTIEGMACGIPQIVPDWAALGTDGGWPTPGSVCHVPCTSTEVTVGNINIIGGVPDEEATINALNRLYHNKAERNLMRQAAFDLVRQPIYDWNFIGEQYDEVLKIVMGMEQTVGVI